MPFRSNTRASTPLVTVTILLVLLLAAHAPLILNDGLFMDDWFLLKPNPNYAVDLGFMLNGAGHPVFFSYFSLANLTGAPILSMKALALAGILLGSVSSLLAATRIDLLTWSEAAGFSLIVWIYPGYQMWAGKANAVYVFRFGLFFIGACLLMMAFNARGTRQVAFRIAAALAFLLSFALNSMMVLYVFAMCGLLVATWRGLDQKQGAIRRVTAAVLRCVAGYPEFVLLPLVYWGVLSIWFKRVGVYAGHYGVHVPAFSELLDGLRVFFLAGYRDVLKNAARAVLDNPSLFGFAVLLIAVAFLLLRVEGKPPRGNGYRIALPLLLGAVLFVVLSLPYLVAGLRPAEHFYESRHLLLFGLPLAFGLLAAKRLVEAVVGERTAMACVFGLASMLSIAALWNGYVFMQARALKQAALSSHLADMPKPAATVYNLDDGFLGYPSRHVPFGVAEVSGMLRLAWGNQPYLGFTLRGERPTILQEIEFLRTAEGSTFHNIDPSGPQGTISLQPGPAAAPNAALVRHYYACRLLAACDVSTFLTQLTLVKIDVGPIAGVTPLTGPN
jgi:hypothetical protein